MYTYVPPPAGQADAATEVFPRAFEANCQPPFGVWTERSAEEEGGIGGGMTNFLTAAGGFLQVRDEHHRPPAVLTERLANDAYVR